MDGTRYADGVLVDTTQLSRTEQSKAFHILRDRLDNWEAGIHSGLALTVNPVNTSRVDMALGSGYAVDGEYVEVLADQLNIQLADNALGAVNWVVVFYTETAASPNPHETNGTIQPTENARGIRVRILTPTDFSALPLTDPTFASDAQDRALLVGIVTATGGALTASNIEQPLSWRSLKYAVMATPPMSGVAIYKVSDDTPEGTTGIIKLDVGPNRLSWQAPGEAGFGTSVNVAADGIYTLTALGGSTIQVSVIVAALSLAGTQVSVSIRGLYTQDVPRMSSTDRHHRSMIGTGIPGPTNPHGLSLDDITPGFATDITLHQQLMHDNGIWRGSASTCLKVSINEAVNPDELQITAPVGDDCYWVHGKRLTAIKNTSVQFTALPITTNKALFDIIVDNVGNVKYSQRLDHTGTNLTGPDNGIVFVNDEVVAGNHTITWLSLGPGNGGYLAWDSSLTPARVLPGTSSGLFLLRNGKQEVWYYIANFAQLPGPAGLYSDVVAVYAPASRVENMLIAQVFYGGDSVGSLGYTNSRGPVPALLVDLRMFGTLRDFNIRDDSLRDMVEYPMDEHHANGVCIGRKDFQGAFGSLWASAPATGLTVTLWGQAPVYVRGKRYVLGSFVTPLTATVPDNTVTVIYVDVDGNIAQVPYVYAAALLLNSPEAFDSTKYYKTLTATYASYPWVYTGTPLAVVASAGGNIVRIIDLRRNLAGGNVNIRPWTVGSIVPTLLYPAYQSVEFYSIDTALLYALAQGQERIECVYATLANPTLTPYQIPTFKNFVLTGTLFIGEDWSSLSAVFQLGDGANITFEDLQIFRSPSFVGGPGLSLVETKNGSTQPSSVVFDNAEIDWQTNGHLAHFIATGPADCTLVVDNLSINSDAAVGLFQFDVTTYSTIQGITALGAAGPSAIIGSTVDVETVMSDCIGNFACDVADLVGNTLRGSFANLHNFRRALQNGSLLSALFTGCQFNILNTESVNRSAFSACSFTVNGQIGSNVAKSDSVSFAGCDFGGTAKLYCDNLQVTGCRFHTSLAYGGEHLQFSACNIDGIVTHAYWATHDVTFSACSMPTFEHTGETVDLYDWHIVGGRVDNLVLQWGAESVRNFTVSACKIGRRILFEPLAMPQAAQTMHGTIDNCDIDLTDPLSQNVQLSFCKNVRITNNRIRGTARFDLPPIRLGQGFGIFGQDMHEIDIEGNEFEIVDVIMASANIGSPVVLVASEYPAPYTAPISIRICGNRFVWRSASASVPANKVMCITYLSNVAVGVRVDRNDLIFEGEGSDVAWSTASGARNALRMGLFMGFSEVNVDNHALNFNNSTFRGNVLSSYGGVAATKWIVYDGMGSANQIMTAGNIGPTGWARMYPAGAGAAFTDMSLNQPIDNAT